MHTQQPTDIRTDTDRNVAGANGDPRTPVQAAAPTYQGTPATGGTPSENTVAIPRESKPGIKTSEFWIMLAMVGATLAATYADQDSLARVDGWRFAAFVVVAYIVSRGLAKIGTADRKIQDRN